MFNSLFRRKEEEERVKHEGRLPPGQALTQKFPVLHYWLGAAVQPGNMGLPRVG